MDSEEEKRFHGPLRGQMLFVVVFFAASLILLAFLPDQTKWVKGTKLAAQPRFWPAIAVFGMVFFAGLHLWYLPRKRFVRDDAREWMRWFWAIEFVLWFLAYVVIVPRLGYLPTTMAFVPLLAWRMGYRSRFYMWVSVAFAVFVVVMFKSMLEVKIPGGMIYEYLPGGLRNFFILNF